MNWSELLKREIDNTYAATVKLMDSVDDDKLDWKPSTGCNWMKTRQLLMHITSACGSSFRGFVTGDWGMPDMSDLKPEDMLPEADKMPCVGSVAQAKKLLDQDRRVALDMLARVSDDNLANKIVTAPWSPMKMALGHQLLQSVDHLKSHKNQLYYYLKLQGKPVNTGDLWGM